MAKPTAQSHATLIREMARETSRSPRSSQHSREPLSPQPTLSDFDPENEAIMSTQQLDNNAQHLPALRASAQKYNRFSRPSRPYPPIQSEPDYAINTSAIGRAFPDFSQGGTSSDEGSISIEIGRGAKKTSNNPISNFALSNEHSSNAQLEIGEDSLDLSVPLIGDYAALPAPPLGKHQSSRKAKETTRDPSHRDSRRRGQSGLRQELSRISPPLSKTKDYVSGEPRKGSAERGPSLAAIHARVRDEIDVSQFDGDRPPTVDLTVRNTRFASGKPQISLESHALPTKFNSARGLLPKSSPDSEKRTHKVTGTGAGTQQSFLLPEMPNMSELISGVFEDGTPVFPRHSKSKSSRFVKDSDRADVAEIPVPEDEQAIFLSLKLLQDKIAVLEKNQAENEVVIQELEQKNQVLESERIQQRRRISQRSDSALGASESDGEERKLKIEKNRLESSAHLLQNKLDAANRKATTAETILRTITQERDSAVSQLSVAYVTIRQVEAENEELKEENRVLRGPTQHLSEGPDTKTNRPGKSDNIGKGPIKILQSQNDHDPLGRSARSAKRSHRHASGTKAKATPDLDIFDFTPRTRVNVDNSRTVKLQNTGGDSDENEASIDEAPTRIKSNKTAARRKSSRAGEAKMENVTRDLTYLSFLDSNEVDKLRKTLEQEHIERKQRRDPKVYYPSKIGELENEQHSQYNQTQRSEQELPKKSSMKDLTSRSVKGNNEGARADAERVLEPNSRRHSEPSLPSTRSRRQALNVDNMTSAFIVPDITLRATSGKLQGEPEVSKEKELPVQHNGENCTVCKSEAVPAGTQIYAIKIPKPVPVSKRLPIIGPDEEEPTMRPSQAPGLALATVIKGLEDEIVHLKSQLARYQALYNGQDPALSKRKRKSVLTKIESLLKTIDIKSDQIYALYDVLEGQKQDDQEMSEQEVEITLQSVGIDPAKLHLRGGDAAESDDEDEDDSKGKTPQRRPWDLSSEDEDDELPWEGIESTVETTRNSSARVKGRSLAA